VTDALVVASAARLLLMEMAAGEAVRRLGESGIDCILLKGPAIARWLYEESEVRPSRDVDLLVRVADVAPATVALGELGYSCRRVGAAACELSTVELELLGTNGVCIDLHHGLLGVPDLSEGGWEVLFGRAVGFRLASGADVRVLDVPARTMHLALHAAQNGPVDEKAVDDLERGLAKLPFAAWQAAATVAQELDALAAFGSGLRLCEAGRRVATELDVSPVTNTELVLRSRSAPQGSLFFERLAEASGGIRKIKLIGRKLWPTSVCLRADSVVPLDRPLSLAGARLKRLASVVRRTPSALSAWRSARSPR